MDFDSEVDDLEVRPSFFQHFRNESPVAVVWCCLDAEKAARLTQKVALDIPDGSAGFHFRREAILVLQPSDIPLPVSPQE